jgi:hypothetical protein
MWHIFITPERGFDVIDEDALTHSLVSVSW